MERALLWQVQCHKHQEGYFRSSRKILCRFQFRAVGSQDSIRTALSRVRTLISQQHPSGWRGNTIRTPISVEKLQIVQGCIRPDIMATRPDASLYYENCVQQKCNCLNARATPSGRGLIQERISTLYGKPVAQFTVRMASACVWTPPR